MTKKHFIALADVIREHNRLRYSIPFNTEHLYALAGFCRSVNPQFDQERWLDYIAGECGPSGGKIKTEATA